jgi:hypothetical protein
VDPRVGLDVVAKRKIPVPLMILVLLGEWNFVGCDGLGLFLGWGYIQNFGEKWPFVRQRKRLEDNIKTGTKRSRYGMCAAQECYVNQ